MLHCGVKKIDVVGLKKKIKKRSKGFDLIHPIRNKNGFCLISFEKLVYWIQILYTGM